MALHYDFSKCNPVPHVALKSETDPKLWAELTPKKGWILSNDGTQKELPSLYFCEQLCWLTLAIGLNTITKKNVNEWHRRILHLHGYNHSNCKKGRRSSVNNIYRSRWRSDGFNHHEVMERTESCLITLEDLKTCIGLSTNAGTMTKSKFAKTYRY
jgi:hypothetical protein